MENPYYNKGLLFVSVIVLLFTSTYTIQVQARDGVFDLYLLPHYNLSKDFKGTGGSSVDFDSSWGIGFGFGYNFTSHLALNFDIGWSSTNYTATTIDDNNNSSQYSSEMESNTTSFTGIYNFSKRAFTPYISGTLGWTFINTNIPSGPPGLSCWWDPWWGYTCSEFLPTETQTNFNYGVGFGFRFDISRSFFMRAAYDKNWIDFKRIPAEDFDVIRIDIGTMFQ